MVNQKEKFLSELKVALENQKFIKLTLSKYSGKQELKNIYVKPVLIKGKLLNSVTYRYKTNDQFKNLNHDELIALCNEFLVKSSFSEANLITKDSINTITWRGTKEWVLKKQVQSVIVEQTEEYLQHDRKKDRPIETSKSIWMQKLGLSDEKGNIFPNASDKYRQIVRYIDLLKSELNKLVQNDRITVVDMGSGKGYLTFALYQYLIENEQFKKKDIHVLGVEYRQDLVDLCNKVAAESYFKGLKFKQSEILVFEEKEIDVLIALHACDTATDDAIFKGIQSQSSLIVTAPCCHKQVRNSIQKKHLQKAIQSVYQFGIHEEQLAELLTDTIRAKLLEIMGYIVKVMPFVSSIHTPKNNMILATKLENRSVSIESENFMELQELKKVFGVSEHHLEQLLLEAGFLKREQD